MQLEYLLFDTSDEEDGACSFDALASVLATHRAGLGAEVEAVLGWAYRAFGSPLADQDGGDWDFDLQAVDDDDEPLAIAYDVARGQVAMPQGCGRVTVALTLSGSRAFADAFREAFANDSD
ncbi:hypothetical protein [Ramlibacter sp.]|uniref:hypothetical protein n=1 Tax=Ramlibacter sp. TaxID=1917967 RepID=UPI003D0DCFF0